jgi:predicted DNA-binding transcriptional regulator AlpA
MPQNKKISAELENFDLLPDSANVHLPTVMGLYGISAATVWRNSGRSIPKPRKLSARATRWNVGELRKTLPKKVEG